MGKNATKRFQKKGPEPRYGRLGGLVDQARMALRELVIHTGMKVIQGIFEEDRARLCGSRYLHQEGRDAYRHGSDDGVLVFGGRKVRCRKPRVRGLKGGELSLPTWEQVQSEDPLEPRVLQQALVGVSTRRYRRSLEPLSEDLEELGVSRSSVSRHLVAKTVQQVDTFLSRKLDPTEFPVMMVDGTNMGDHTLVVVLGIDASGRKQVLGMEEGSTESEEVCTSLLRSLIERGLKVEQARLFVIDGGKGIRKSIRTVFAQWALIQRCRVHKMRNLMDHLPENRRASIKAALHGAWSGPTVPEARRRLKRLAAELTASHPGAASSILEGLDETLTLIGLGIDSDLVRILSSTNIIENLQTQDRVLTVNYLLTRIVIVVMMQR